MVRFDVLTRQLVLASLMAAMFAGRGFMPPETRVAMAAAFVGVAVLSVISTRAAAALVLGTAFITPALIILGFGFYYGPEAFVWLAALAALVSVRSWREPWAIPSPIRWPLATWALVVALTWPVVLLREANFSPALMSADGRFAGALWISASWIAAVASIHMLGILWLDWLFRQCDGQRDAWWRDVAVPLTVSWLLTIALGMYQATVDISFANGGAHMGLGRASGGLMDANPFGVGVALWGPFVYLLCARMRSRWAQPLGMAALALSWYGMWVSGSRGAFGAAVIGLIAVVVAEASVDARRRRWTFAMLVVAVALVAAVAWLAPVQNSPIRRLAPMFAGLTTSPFLSFVAERWDPYFYGRTAWRAAQDSPLFGIGLGSFQGVVGDYSVMLGHKALLTDNAQNWFRHQFTELGLLGSIGWAVWVVCAGVLLLAAPKDRRSARIAKGVFLATAAVSLIGMPGQNVAFVLIFWTCAFFVSQQVTPRWPVALAALDRGRARLMPLAIALVCAGGTWLVGLHEFMPVLRAARFKAYYAYGVTDFAQANGRGEFTMHGRRAMVAVQPSSAFVKLSVARVAGSTPGDVHVSVAGRELVSGPVSSAEQVQYLTLKSASEGIVVDAASEVDLPAPDGLRVRWEFLSKPE